MQLNLLLHRRAYAHTGSALRSHRAEAEVYEMAAAAQVSSSCGTCWMY